MKNNCGIEYLLNYMIILKRSLFSSLLAETIESYLQINSGNSAVEELSGASISLPNIFNHHICQSDLPILFMVWNFYRSNLPVLFTVKNLNTTFLLIFFWNNWKLVNVICYKFLTEKKRQKVALAEFHISQIFGQK